MAAAPDEQRPEPVDGVTFEEELTAARLKPSRSRRRSTGDGARGGAGRGQSSRWWRAVRTGRA